jgi:hypothetical protein
LIEDEPGAGIIALLIEFMKWSPKKTEDTWK